MGEDKHRQMVEKLKKENVHIFAAIILGCPEDTTTSFRNSIHDLLDLGFDVSIRCYLYALLPNAPANESAYRKKYGIKTKRSKIVGPITSNTDLDSSYYPKIDYIVSHDKMTSKDWINNCQYYGYISGLHNLGITRHLAKFLKLTFGISYSDFYKNIFEHFLCRPETVLGQIIFELEAWLTNFLIDPNHDFFIRADEDNLLYEHEKWIYIKIIEQKDRFYQELNLYLSLVVKNDPLLSDLILFQSFSIFPIDACENDTLSFNYNWVGILNALDHEHTNNSRSFFEPTPCQITRSDDLKVNHIWLGEKNPGIRRVSYVKEILGSMIYKNSKSLIGLNAFNVALR